MPDFYHAPTCPCGQCQHEPAEGPAIAEKDCGCLFNDGEMYFCSEHEELELLKSTPPIQYRHSTS